MSFQLTILYGKPTDQESFDKHYRDVHAELTKLLPGLDSYVVCRPGLDAMGKAAPYHLIGSLTFQTEEGFVAALGSPQGEALLSDISKLGGSEVVVMTGPSEQLA